MLLRTSTGADYLVLHSPNDTPHERAVLLPMMIEGTRLRVVRETAPYRG